MNTDPYLTTQIITYMGNKRKLLHKIKEIVVSLENKENRKLSIGDGFSGSGIVSRLFNQHASQLYTNDLSGYSKTLNQCFLTNLSPSEMTKIDKYISTANKHADNKTNKYLKPFVSLHWAPSNELIGLNDRVYFTHENGIRIDIYRNYIDTLPEKFRPFLLAVLLVECSIHNNTNGQFSAFYKNGDIGQYGGKKNIDLRRITQPITLHMPVQSQSQYNVPRSDVHIHQMDTNLWVRDIPELDLVYFDPPYNKHPYCIFYFLLDIINNWNTQDIIPDSYRGQPKTWTKSHYNSSINAKKTFEDLISNTRSKYILLSYNSGGIIDLDSLDTILSKYGSVEKIPVDHKTYNKLKGISEYKRVQDKDPIQEYFWLLTKNI